MFTALSKPWWIVCLHLSWVSFPSFWQFIHTHTHKRVGLYSAERSKGRTQGVGWTRATVGLTFFFLVTQVPLSSVAWCPINKNCWFIYIAEFLVALLNLVPVTLSWLEVKVPHTCIFFNITIFSYLENPSLFFKTLPLKFDFHPVVSAMCIYL